MDSIITFLLYNTPLFYLIQPLWRDEAFSYFISTSSIGQIIVSTAGDFNPPLYYIVLHFWIGLVGHSDSGLRMLSFVFHLMTVYISYLLGKRLFSPRFAIFLALFTFFNPMLLYFAFEIRMYSLYALCVIGSFYFLLQKNWRWYTLFCVMGLYTHSFFIFVPLSYALHALITNHKKKPALFRIVKPFIFFLLWIPVIVRQFSHSGASWIFPVSITTVMAAPGTLFTSYEGTPPGLWAYVASLSVVVVIFCSLVLYKRSKVAGVLLVSLLFPFTVIMTYSLFFRPLFVNRYLINITLFVVIAITAGIATIQHSLIRKSTAWLWLLIIFSLNLLAPSFHRKVDFRSSFAEINDQARPTDYVFTKTPIALLESAYYYRDPDRVFVYNPDNIFIPNYIGVTVVFPNISKWTLPEAPSRTFFVGDDASYDILIQQ